MSYVHLSRTIVDPLISSVQRNLVNSDHACDNQLSARGAFLGIMPLSFVVSAIDTAIGVVSGSAAIVTCGRHEATNTFASNHLRRSKRLLSHTYTCLLSAVNPS